MQVGLSMSNVTEGRVFAKWLLNIGDGIVGVNNDEEVDG